MLLAERFGLKAMALPSIGARSSICRESGPNAGAAVHAGHKPDGTRGGTTEWPLAEGGSSG